MAAAQGLYAESASDVTAATTTWVDVCEISAASFTASATYLIVANAIATSNGSATEIRLRLVHGTTPTVFADASLAYETANTDQQGISAGWMTVFTQPGTAELVKLQVSNSATDTSRCQLAQIFALKLGDVGSQNTDWFYTEDLVDYTTTASMVSKASITFTPNGTDDWLFIGSFAQVPGAVNSNYRADMNDSVAGILDWLDIEGEDTTNEVRGHMLVWVAAPTNASHTFSMRFGHEAAAGTVRSNRIFALNLNKFSQHAFSLDAVDDTPAASPSWTTTRTIAPTPNVTGDWFIFGHFVDSVNVLTDSLGTRLQINPSGGGLASNPNYGDDMPKNDNSWDATDSIPISIFKMLSMSSGASRTANLDVQRISGTTVTVFDRMLIGFSLELAGGGTQYNQSVSGTLTSAGALVKQTNKVLAGTLTSSGALTKQDRTTFAGTLTSSGALVKQTQKVFAGTLTSSGALVNQAQKVLTGTLTSAGTLVKHTSTSFAGTMSSVGTLVKHTSTSLAGTLTSSGVAVATKVALVSLGGTLNMVGSLVNQVQKVLSGAVTPTGALVKQTQKPLGGTLTSSGALASIKAALVSLGGTLNISGSLVNQTQKTLGGTLAPVGTMSKQTLKALGGTLTSAGSLVKFVQTSFSGTLSSSGSLVKQISTSFVGTLTSAGSLVKQTSKGLAGTLTSSGALTSIKAALVSVGGTLNMTGALTKQTFKGLAGTLTSTGDLIKKTFTSLGGTLSSAGGLLSSYIPGGPVVVVGIIRGVVNFVVRPIASVLTSVMPIGAVATVAEGLVTPTVGPTGSISLPSQPIGVIDVD